MHERTIDQTANYFRELALSLRSEGFTVGDEADGLLSVKLDGLQLCYIMGDGGVRYWREEITNDRLSEALERVTGIARTTDEYMSQMEATPFLTVGSQENRYRLLADFNGTVLAGCQTKYGVQFVTWERSPDRPSLNNGHYYGPGCGAEGYTAAKQDFATRSGLIPSSALFTPEQMTEIYRRAQEALENDGTLTVERENLLREVNEKIEICLPQLGELVRQAEAQEPKQGMEQSW